jgi:hypothetical protein
MRPIGMSAIIRCKNEEEFIIASIMSVYRIFDEIVVILNRSTDRTRELVEGLLHNYPKVRLLEYSNECSRVGPGYYERVLAKPESSLAKYYNWCAEQTSFSHVCKWDGDMIATPVLEQVPTLIESSDVVCFDGYDVLGELTTWSEPRIFRYDPAHARYEDFDFYEAPVFDYTKVSRVPQKCYLHMKLVKKEWIGRRWSHPNWPPTRLGQGIDASATNNVLPPRAWIRRLAQSLQRQSWGD